MKSDRLNSRAASAHFILALLSGTCVASGKMLSFPDSYLLRGLLTLVAISLMVPGIFGVAPPRYAGRLPPLRLSSLSRPPHLSTPLQGSSVREDLCSASACSASNTSKRIFGGSVSAARGYNIKNTYGFH